MDRSEAVLALVHRILEGALEHGVDVAAVVSRQALGQQHADLITGGGGAVERRGGVVRILLLQADLGAQRGDVVAAVGAVQEGRIGRDGNLEADVPEEIAAIIEKIYLSYSYLLGPVEE